MSHVAVLTYPLFRLHTAPWNFVFLVRLNVDLLLIQIFLLSSK